MVVKPQSFSAQALRLFFRFSGWVGGPVIVAALLGKWLDERFSTAPWLFLLMIALAFIATSIALTREAIRAMREMEKESPSSDSSQ